MRCCIFQMNNLPLVSIQKFLLNTKWALFDCAHHIWIIIFDHILNGKNVSAFYDTELVKDEK